MIDSNTRLFAERLFCGNYLKDMTKSSEINIIDDRKYVKSPIRVGIIFPSKPPTDEPSGGSILLCGKRQSYFPFQCFVGPDWPMLILVYTLIISINIIILPIISFLGWPVLFIGISGFILLLYFYSAVACSDPGIIFIDDDGNLQPNNNHNHDQYEEENQPIMSFNSTGNDLSPIMSPLPTENILLSDSVSSSTIANTKYVNNDVENQFNNNNTNNNDDHLSGINVISNRNNDELERNLSDNDDDSYESTLHLNPNKMVSQISQTNTNNVNTEVMISSNREEVISSNSQLSTMQKRKANSSVKLTSRELPGVKDGMECGICELKRPRSAHHCHHCGVCVDELDHHCPCKYCFILLNTQCYMQLSLYRL